MARTWVRVTMVGAVMLTAAACGRSPTAPDPAPPSAMVREGDTATIPGTDLTVTVRAVVTAASIDCLANVRCNLTSIAMLEVKVPSAGVQRVDVRLPNPDGGDRASYGGYMIRVPSLQAPVVAGQPFVVTITAARE